MDVKPTEPVNVINRHTSYLDTYDAASAPHDLKTFLIKLTFS